MGYGSAPFTKADLDALLGYDVDAHEGRHASAGADAIGAGDLVAGADPRSSSHATRHAYFPSQGDDYLEAIAINAPHLDEDLRVPRNHLNDPSLSAAGLLRSRIGTELDDQVLVAAHQRARQIANLGNGVLVAVTAETSDPWAGSIVRSVDYGATWTTVLTESGQAFGSCIPLPGGIVLAGSANSKVYRSTDRGLTWTALTGCTGVRNITNLCYLGNGVVLAGATSVWSKSTDYGATWAEKGAWAIKYMGAWPAAVAYLENGIVIMACRHTVGGDPLVVARSTDFGESWAQVTVAATPAGEDTLAICYLGNGLVLASASSDRVCYSTDYGVTWADKLITDQLQSLVYLGDGLVLGGSYGTQSSKSSIWRSEDYGNTWSEESHSGIADSGDHYWLEFIRENGVLLAATGPGCKVLRSEEWPIQSGKGGGDFVQPTGLIEVPADHEVLGRTVRGQAGENLALFEVCYLKSDGKLWKSKADAAATMPALYMATGALAAEAYGTFLVLGYARDDTWNWTVGGFVYAFDDTGGAMIQVAPSDSGDQVQRLGIAVTADLVFFKPDLTILEIA